MDTSDQVWFANDQLAIRFIEEIDFDYAAADATAALLTAEEPPTPVHNPSACLALALSHPMGEGRGEGSNCTPDLAAP